MKKLLQVLICSLLVLAVADSSYAFLWFGGGGGGKKKSQASVAAVQPNSGPSQSINGDGAGNGKAKEFQPAVAEPNSVPEPATMILLGAGLVGLAISQRKKFKK